MAQEKTFVEIEKLDPHTKEGTESRQITLPAEACEHILELVDYLYYPLEELLGDSLQIAADDKGNLLKIWGDRFRITINKETLFYDK